MALSLKGKQNTPKEASFVLLSLFAIILVFTTCKNEDKDLKQTVKYFNELDVETFRLESKFGYQKAIEYLDSVKNKNHKISNITEIIRLDILANYYLNQNKLDSAKYFVDKIVPILIKTAKPNEIPKQYTKAYLLLNDIYFARKNYLEAYKWLYLGRQIANKNLNNCDMAQFNYRIGVVLYVQENYRLANKNFRTSFDQSINCDSNFRFFYRQQETLNNIGFTYFKFGEIDSSLLYYRKVIELLKQNENRFIAQKNYFNVARGVVYGNMGQSFNKKGDFNKAIALLKTSININKVKGNDENDAFLQRINLARVYLNAKKLNDFEALSKEIKPALDTLNGIKSNASFYALLSDFYLIKGDTVTAFENLKIYNNLSSKIIEQDKLLNQTSITEQLNNNQNQDNYVELKKINTIKSIYLTVSIVIIALILALIVVIYFYWSKSKKTVKILSELNNKINKQSQELKFQNLEKDKILRIVAHDLRNPIGGICSISRILMLEDLSEDELEMILMIESASNDSLQLISEILEFTDGSLDKTKFEKIDINQVIHTSIALLKFKTDEKNQNIIHNKPNEPIYILGNRVKISRVFSNLIINASKFSNPYKNISIAIKEENDVVIISITDEGIGIPDEIKHDIFKPFAANKRKGTANEKSFGMGLSICKQIVDMHQGEINFNSNSKGSVFYVKLLKIKL